MMERLATPASENSFATVRAWLWTCAALVFLMVVVGGATRLTESGLSITQWKLVSGILPPLTEAQWSVAFDEYKHIPQYAQLFPTMTLGEFQFIFAFEWFHRLLGRLIGLVFAVPLLFFWATRRLPPGFAPKLAGLFVLGGLQGVVGWWMVKSGLSERVEVSQYRLAIHLLLASLTYAALIWLVVGLTAPHAKQRPMPVSGAGVIVALVFAQIGLGALVAGLRAGRIYNTWPLMDGRLVPPSDVLFAQTPWWTNFFENITQVQFQHRMIAYALLAMVIGHAASLWRHGAPRSARMRGLSLVFLVAMQASIGIMTLILVVPIWAGLLHQAFAMLVLGMAMVHRRRLASEEQGSSVPSPGLGQNPKLVNVN